jgi:polysaccharide biosynthesis protein PelC
VAKFNAFIALVLLGALAGCASFSNSLSRTTGEAGAMRLFVPPFFNATGDEHAGRALTELTVTALLHRGIPVAQTEAALAKTRVEDAPDKPTLFLETAKSLEATHLLVGTVHEYRYKTDLDGNPAVGVTLRLVDATDGRTVWQDSESGVGMLAASLSSVAQRSIRKLVNKIPF